MTVVFLQNHSLSERIRRVETLLFALVYRDISARYRRSMLGPLWAILQPLTLMVVFSLLRGVMGIPSEGMPYILFSYAGLLPWTFFSNAVVYCGPSILSNASVVKKIALPREVFPLAAVVTALFDFLMAGLVMAGMLIFYRVPVGWSLLWLPVLCLNAALLAFAVGMALAAMATFKRDFIIAAPFLMQIWLFITPVLYPLSSVPERWQSLYLLNPMVGIIEGVRAVLLRAETPALGHLVWSVLMTLVVLAMIWPFFRWLSRYFADTI
jgi:lipopolysaccharide transport system permease protein